MAICGYGTTLAGSSSGTLTGVESVTTPTDTLENIVAASLGDTNRIPTNIPGGLTGGAMQARLSQTISGYGATCVGASSGAMNAQSIRIGGGSTAVINVKQLGDTNRVSNNIPGELTEAPITVVVVGDKTDEDKCHAAQLAQTVESWVTTGADGSTWTGNGHITSVSGGSLGTNGVYTFTITIQPTTTWTFVAGTSMSLYATLYTAWKAHTSQTWTAVAAGSGFGTYAGSGFISSIGGIDLSTDKAQGFDVTFTPDTLFSFTKA
jgi:hypothetical protein